MASDDIAQLADALSKTHVGDGELSYKGLGLKLDNAESGENMWLYFLFFFCCYSLVCAVDMKVILVDCLNLTN